jgi:hypothetical protein
MNLLDQLGIALGLATLAGVNLYLTVLVAGLAVRFQWLELSGDYGQLAVLGNPWVLGVAAVLFVTEFFADKVPWFDTFWDGLHTLIRPIGGMVLALTALGELNPVALLIAALLAGGASLSTHGAKAGVRAAINLSPEPVSNSVASVTEDGLVLGGLVLTGWFPAFAFFLFLVVAVTCAVVAIWLWRRLLRKRPAARS